MADFDIIEDFEEVLHPLCLCINHDSSRIGVGHQKGYVIYEIHRGDKNSEDAPLSTSVESVYPPLPESADTASFGWDIPTEGSSISQNKTHTTINSASNVGSYAPSVESVEGGDTQLPALSQLRLEIENGKTSQAMDVTPILGKSRTSMTPRSNEGARPLSLLELETMVVENGVGVMALLCRTKFVAVVGGGPYPIGPRNVVKIFVTGSHFAEHSFNVGGDVEALRLDHRLIIVLTTVGLQLYSFDTYDCLLSVPNTPSPKERVLPSSHMVGSFWNGDTANASKSSANTQNRDGTHVANTKTGASPFLCSPIAIDYGHKCLCYRSSPCGFSFLRYDAESGVEPRSGAKLLATVTEAHAHSLAALAMDLSGDGSGGSGQRWLVASCSEWATLIRIWQYCDHSKTSEGAERTVKRTQETGSEHFSLDNFRDSGEGMPGTFVMIKEVRNAATPTPIFQLMFLGEFFLSCVASNQLKIFFIGEREEPKPYDISTKDPAKVMRAQNHYSSLHHFSLVSSYFSSEWAACECPLPLTDKTFLPKWVDTTTGSLRQHLFRGHGTYASSTTLGSSTSMASGDPDGNAFKTSSGTKSTIIENTAKNQREETSSSSDNPRSRAQKNLGASALANWGGLLRSYVAPQLVAPVLSTAGLAMMWYMGSSANAYDSRQVASIRLPLTKLDSSQDCFQDRDYATMTEIAQSLLVWWEKPAYWELDCMAKGSARGVTTYGGENASMGKQKIRTTVICCVTCDGSALRFNFDPVAGTVSCSKAVPTIRA